VQPLDNPAWYSLALQPTFAEGDDRSRRYLRDVDAIAALPDVATAENWAALAALVPAGQPVHMLRTSFELPDTWDVAHSGTVVQMVGAERPPELPGGEFEELGPADAPEMLALALATQPGPFAPRTGELGAFIGIRDGGRLVAMAGERFVLPGMTEVSAVCTDPAYRGRGWAALLTAEIARRIWERGQTPFLHVVEQNTTARRVYERIGFADRTILQHRFVSPRAS
jgi:ribosomal protein S18 acetylase RimI-like enzyme